MNDPDRRAPIASPYTAQIGRNDDGQACRNNARRAGTPRAIAAITNGWCTASAIDCDCSRSKVAAIGNESAITGSGRCQRTSAIHVNQRGSLAVADTMPPAGSQPVRAARKTKASEVISGGSDTHTSDAPRTIVGNTPERAPVKMPSDSPTTVAISSDKTPSSAVFAAARATSGATGRL